MSKRLEILEKLLEYVNSNENIQYKYVDEDGCYCAVGFIMNELKLDLNEILNSSLNKKIISNLPTGMINSLTKHFSKPELEAIQEFNDCEVEANLIEYINSLIEKERVQNEK